MFAPGEGWGYSNIGYLTIKLLLERVTGMSLREMIARHITDATRPVSHGGGRDRWMTRMS